MKIELHIGQANCPPLITIINQKLDLVERLNSLIDGRNPQSDEFKMIRDMMKIEMDAINEIIQIDK